MLAMELLQSLVPSIHPLYEESIMGASAKQSSPKWVCILEIQAIASDFSGMQTHEGELSSTRAPMIDSISSTMLLFQW